MSVATKNPFAILDSEGTSRPSSPPPEPTKQAAPAPSRGNQRSRGGPSSRGGRYYQRGGGARSAPKDADQPQNASEEAPAEPRKFENGRGRGRGRGGERGGRGGRRPFDRHSQTGKTDSDKKFHQGWGGEDGDQELKAEQAATVDAAAEGDTWTGDAAQADWGSGDAAAAEPTTSAPAEEDKEKAESKPRKEEEEDNTLTLDQYNAKKKEQETAVPKLEGTRRPNEGADETIWKGAVPLTKNEQTESYFVGKAKTAPKPRTKKEEKIFIEIDGHFDRPERGGRGRGRGDRGRGERGRGERSRGGRGGRGGRYNGSAATPEIDVADETAFPSLS